MTEHDDRLPIYDVIWNTIADDFPPLVTALEQALAGEPD